MRAEIGLGLQSDKRPGEYASIARRAEAAGIDVLSVFSDLLYQPPVTALVEIAEATDRVRLGAACWNPFTLHPYEIAGQWAAVDRASHGRAYLGLAKGTWLGRIGVAQPRPLAHLREAVGFIRALLAGEAFDGEVFSLVSGTRLRYALERESPEFLLGSWGPLGAALAGEVADELKVGGTANPAMVRLTRERIAVGADRAGRDAHAVRIVAGAVTVIDRDRETARALARTEVAMYLDVIADLDETVTLPPGLLDMVRAGLERGDAVGAGRAIPGDVLDLFALAGDPDDIAARAQALIDAGAGRVEFGTPLGPDPLAAIDLLGEAVLPLLDRGD